MPDKQSEQLRAFYPHMERSTAGDTNLGALKNAVLEKSTRSALLQQQFFEHHSEALIAMAAALAGSFSAGGRLLCMGNGGSGCDAAHLAVEFNHPVTAGRPALPAINLVADTAMITAVGNDVGIEHIFLRQVLAHGRRGDALFAISTSGNSANLMGALLQARDMGIATFALSGGSGGEIAACGIADHCLVVDTDSVHRVQETHVIAYHILWDLVHTLMSGKQP